MPPVFAPICNMHELTHLRCRDVLLPNMHPCHRVIGKMGLGMRVIGNKQPEVDQPAKILNKSMTVEGPGLLQGHKLELHPRMMRNSNNRKCVPSKATCHNRI
eukprot:1157218-Pelagomonas_calceolata.AAC.25